jgi:hypothetical protein
MRLEWLWPALIAALSWVWLFPTNTYLYGQDSLSFLHPFGPNTNPLAQYNTLYSWTFPVPDETPAFYSDGLNYLLEGILPSDPVRQRVLIFLAVLVAALGVWMLLRTFNRINGRAPERLLGARIGATAFYVMNPFTLSIVWWHFEGWDYFVVLLPFLIWLLLEITYSPRIRPTFIALVVVLSILLAPGTAGAWAVVVALPFAVFAAGIVIQSAWEHALTRRVWLKVVTMLAIVPACVAWTTIPYLLIPNFAIGSTNFVSFGNLHARFVAESQSTSTWNVLTLNGFVWVHNVPNAYGVAGIEAWAFFDGVLCLACLIVGWFALRSSRGLSWLYAIALLSIFASTGANLPAGPLNEKLLSAGGPFLLLVNAYYFLGEYYVLLVTVMVVAIPAWALGRLAPAPSTESPPASVDGGPPSATAPAPPEGPSPRPSGRWSLQGAGGRKTITGLALLLVATLVISSAIPFLVGPVFQQSGPNIDAFVIPSSYPDLATYLDDHESGTPSFALDVPMSSIGGVPLDLGHGGFLDSANLISNYVPSPVLQSNTGDLTASLMNYFAACSPCLNLRGVLSDLHVGTVIWDPFVNVTSPFVTRSPDGAGINLTEFHAELNATLGPPASAGEFEVYEIAGTVPIVAVWSGLTGIVTNSLASYLAFINALNPDSITVPGALSHGVWTTAAPVTPGFTSVQTIPFDGVRAGFSTRDPASALVINSSGDASSLANWSAWITSSSPPGSFSLTSPELVNLSDSPEITTTMNRTTAGYSSPPDVQRTLGYSTKVDAPVAIELSLRASAASTHGNWVETIVSAGPLGLRVELYSPGAAGPYTLSLAALWNGAPFAWDNTPMTNFLNGSEVDLSLNVAPGQMTAAVNESGTVENSTVWFSNRSEVLRNPGFNLTLAPVAIPDLANSTVQFQSVYPNLTLTRLDVVRPLPVEFLVLPSGPLNSTLVPATTSQVTGGDWDLTFTCPNGTGSLFVVNGIARSGLWSVRGVGITSSALDLNPDQNTFAVTGLAPGRSVELTVHFAVYLNDGLYFSIAELLAFPAVAIVLERRRR